MEKKINKYLKGTATPNEFSEVLAVLCAEESDGKVSVELLEHWKKILTTEIECKENIRLLDKIHHRIALEESKPVASRFTIYRNLLKIAAALIIGLMITTLLFYNQQKSGLYAEMTEAVTTPYGARTNFKLPDGTEVWLNSGSVISFPKRYGAVREVELTGQAYFHVVKDGKPFFVKTSYGKVEVMGTSFDVKAYADDDFEITLVEGSVKVSDKANQVAILKPGQQSVITSSNAFTCKEVKTDLITSWKDGKLIFVKEPFEKVTKELERWYNVKIELQGERLKKLCYTGTIEMESFSEVLDLINATTKIKSSFDKHTRILKISGR
jgi:ferric-dicitrate binding protein FerR (iron transport regulator)